MRKHDNFELYCYKYAPESFKAWHNGKLMKLDNSNDLGYMYITKGSEACINELKRIVRKQQAKNNRYATIGFYGIEQTKEYYYTKQLLARKDNLHDMLQIYKDWKNHILGMNCQLPSCTTGKLDGNFKTIEKHTEYNTVNINRPLIVNIKMI